MNNVFEHLTQQLVGIGFFTYFVPFVIVTAIFYALLKKSRILGDSVFVNGMVSISAGLLVFGAPILIGIDISRTLSLFFIQAFSFLLVFFIGVLISALFYPNLLKVLEETMKRRTTMYAMLAIGLALFILSGLFSITYESGTQPLKYNSGSYSGVNGGNNSYVNEEKSNLNALYIITTVLIIFVVILLIGGYTAKGVG